MPNSPSASRKGEKEDPGNCRRVSLLPYPENCWNKLVRPPSSKHQEGSTESENTDLPGTHYVKPPNFLFISVTDWVLQRKQERCYLCPALRDILISNGNWKWEILPLWVNGCPRSYVLSAVVNSS